MVRAICKSHNGLIGGGVISKDPQVVAVTNSLRIRGVFLWQTILNELAQVEKPSQQKRISISY
jgi:hypothetical protein